MKICSRCKIEKEDTDFSKNYKNPNLLRVWCKNCVSENSLIWQLNHKERFTSIQKKYRTNNPDKCKTNRGLPRIKPFTGLSKVVLQRFGKEVAEEVYKRDNYRCRHCLLQNDLTIHHIDHKGRNYENIGLKPNNDVSNLIVLCRSCHGKLHGKQKKGIRKER